MSNRWIFIPNSFVPSDVSGLQLWLASDSNTFQNSNGTTAAAADSDPVGYWGDKSGNSRNFIQATSGFRPLLRTNVKNSKPVIRFDGTDDRLTCATALSNFIANSACTVFVVFKSTASPGNATIYQNPGLFVDGTSGFWGLYCGSTVKVGLYNWDGNLDKAESTIDTSNYFITMGRHESGNLYSSVNAGSEASAASGNTQSLTGTMFVGVDRLGNTFFLNGDIAEIICYNTALSTTNISNVYTYLNNKYAVY